VVLPQWQWNEKTKLKALLFSLNVSKPKAMATWLTYEIMPFSQG